MDDPNKQTFTETKGWRSIESAPKNKDVMLLVRNAAGDQYMLLRPARLLGHGWVML